MTQTRKQRSGVEDRWTKSVRDEDGKTKSVPSAANGKGKRWRARYVDEDGQEHAKGFARKVDAQAWLNEVVSAQVTGTYIDPQRGKVTFASFYTEWAKRQIWESGTKHAMDLAANSVTFANLGLGDLQPVHLEVWVKSMQDRKLAATTIKTRFANVRAVIRAAVRDKFMARDVTAKVTLPRIRKASAAMRIPTAEQVGDLIRACDEIEPWVGPFIAVCAFVGLRKGEASALTVGHVDFIRKEIHVQQQVQWTDDGKMEIRAPKYESERDVFAPAGLITMLSEYVRLYRPGDDGGRYLFPGARDQTKPTHHATVGRWWRMVCKHVGIDFRLHDCRHFYASGLINAGCDVVTVQRALGHSAPSITLDTYSHLWPNAEDRTRKAAEGLVDAAFAASADALRTGTSETPAD